MANSTDIVGWAFSGALYCPDHCPYSKPFQDNAPSPVFLDYAVPGDDVCDVCHCPLVEA